MLVVSKQFEPVNINTFSNKKSVLSDKGGFHRAAGSTFGESLLANMAESEGMSFDTMSDLYRINAWIRSIVDKIENRVTQVDLVVKKVDLGKDAPEKILKTQEEHVESVNGLIRDPNDGAESFYEIRKKTTKDLLLFDSAGIEIVRGKRIGDGKEIPAMLFNVPGDEILLNIDKTGAFRNPLSSAYHQIKDRRKMAEWGLWDFMYFVKNPRSGFPYGLAPLESLIMPVSGDLQADKYNLDFFSNNARPNIAFLFDNLGFGRSQNMLERAKRWYLDNHQAQPHLPLFMGTEKGEVKLQQIQISNKDMEHKDYQVHNLMKMMAVFGMQPFVMGVITETTGKLNSEEQSVQFKIDAVLPYLKVFNEKFNIVVIWNNNGFGYSDVFIDHDELDIKDEDALAKQRERYLKNGVLTVDEVRDQLGLARVPWGQFPFIPVNLSQFGGQVPGQENGVDKSNQLDSLTALEMVIGSKYPTGLEYVGKSLLDDAVGKIIKDRERLKNIFRSFPDELKNEKK